MFCIVAPHLASRPSTPEFCESSIMDFIESTVETDLLFTICCRFVSLSDDAFGSVEANAVETGSNSNTQEKNQIKQLFII
jgi:hypothetical protein